MYLAAFIIPSLLTRLPVPAATEHPPPHSLTLPLPYQLGDEQWLLFGVLPKEFNFHPVRPMLLEAFKCC